MNQILAVKNHLETKGHITSLEAIQLYGATRLSSIIHTLRHKYNMNIDTQFRTDVNRYGSTTTYGIYVLKEGD